MTRHARWGSSAFDAANFVLITLIGIVTLYPMLYVLVISLSPIEEIMRSAVVLYPKRVTFEAYRFALTQAGVPNAYGVTIYITVLGTCINLVLTSLGAYVLSKRYLPGRAALTVFVIISLIFNGGLIPYYLVVRGARLTGTLWSLMIPNGINTFYLIIMRNFFSAIPSSLEESATIDGASDVRVLAEIILPLSTPVLATLGLFYAVAHWNEYFYAIIFLNKSKMMPLQVLIRRMYQSGADMMMFENSVPPPVETIKAATIIIATLPIICLYPFLQKYFVKGIMIGAVKG